MESCENECPVCHESIDVFAIGKCDHPICFKCSTRMRALCEQFYCPICRTDIPEVFFLVQREKFDEMPVRKFIADRRLKIQFETSQIQEMCCKLLEHRCSVCKDAKPEKSFRALKDHMRREHTLFYCDLCIALKIFTGERKVYTRPLLALHRRQGDKDDTSYKEHPLCHFCEERYLDKDELYKHLRKDHFYCHFCESLGSQDFYDDYPALRDHFHADHFLCEEGECQGSQFTNAFRSDIDLKSHQVEHHSKAQTRAQAKQERTLNIDFNFAPRPNSRGARGGRSDYEGRHVDANRKSDGRNAARNKSEKYNTSNVREQRDLDRAIQASLSTMSEADMKSKDSPRGVQESGPREQQFSTSEEHFPTLGDTAPSRPPAPVRPATSALPLTSSSAVPSPDGGSSHQVTLADRFAMATQHTVQHGGLDDFPALEGRVARQENSNNTRQHNKSATHRMVPKEDDFPELPTSTKQKAPVSSSWVKNTKPKSESKKHVKEVPTSVIEHSARDFPSLGQPSNLKSNWFRAGNSQMQQESKSKSKKSENPAPSLNDYRERLSPVNIPNSNTNDNTSKVNQKKKKKKDKLTEIKDEKTAPLRNNSSLDDIAGLLMATTVSQDDSHVVSKLSTESVKPSTQSVKPSTQSVKPSTQSVKPSTQSVKPSTQSVKPSTESVKPSTQSVKPSTPPFSKKKEDKIEKLLEKSRNEEVIVKNITAAIEQENENRNGEVSTKLSVEDTDFPALMATTVAPKPPPGFISAAKSTAFKSAPPGLGHTNSFRPPPGFIQSTSAVSKETFKSDTAVSPSVAKDYTQPNDFQDRNQLLIGKIRSICAGDTDDFKDFKMISGKFRQNDIDASEYYHACTNVLGKANFDDIFPELLALLPDISKQRELLDVHMTDLTADNSVGTSKQRGTSVNSGFLCCDTCGQVLVRGDYHPHVSTHHLQDDFPSLVSDRASAVNVRPATWVRSK
ncbi:E3 ubiquitin-protein ligase ZNF598-like [Dreissena polymorpha]|uniref:RING-type E3 ubiquitin transferase n=1 Tax=Dreissena polymorpha TaxID=45954 RepID=A0A9D4RNM2_DREPO|nr:E3 ubiquitin-protein ligase ZNF598-like [Dreissena polymorpha]KAH3872987.1 hypothetical protein DPMN_036211 [Dreissena polymorpha]